MIIAKDATTPIPFLLVSAADGYSAITGASPTVTIARPGQAFAAAAGTIGSRPAPATTPAA